MRELESRAALRMTGRSRRKELIMAIGAFQTDYRNNAQYAEYFKTPAKRENFSANFSLPENSGTQENENGRIILKEFIPPAAVDRGPSLKERMEESYQNEYFWRADESGMIEYNGVVFACNKRTNTLELGDCSNPANCIYVALEKGGSLLVNRDNIGELSKAISMFSPKDVESIMRALQKDRMAQNALSEIEESKSELINIGAE